MLFTFNLWNVFGIIAVLLFAIFARKRNSIWLGLAGGLVVGLVMAIIYSFKGNGFAWELLMKAAIVGVLAGSLLELFLGFSRK